MRTERLRTVILLAALLACPGLTRAASAQESQAPAPPAPSSAAMVPQQQAAPAPLGEERRPSAVITGDHTVAPGESVDDLVVVGGDLHVEGEIRGDAVVVGGDLVLESTGSVLGNAVVTGGEIVQNGGRVRGEMRVVSGDIEGLEEALAIPGPRGRNFEIADHEGRHFERDHDFGLFRSIRHGFAGILSTLAFGLVLAGVGSLLIFYGQRYLETVSDTIRTSTVRAGGVGLAALFLVVPAFVVLVVALAVSIIGIPFLLVAVPLYPLAIAAAAAFGLLAAAHALGERTAEQRRDVYDLRYRNSYAYLFTGLGMLLAPLLAADLISMTGFLNFIGVLLKLVTWVAIWIATTIGFGAVILSRFGTQRGFIQPAPTDAPLEPDPLFEDDTTPRGSDV